VTTLMSNDATAVVLTPAVLTAVKRAKARPMPCLLTCALIANAASFVLPISNPANLVVFDSAMPPLGRWLVMFLLPSAVSIVATYFLLRWYSRNDLAQPCHAADGNFTLTAAGRISLFGILAVAAVLLIASALRWNLGLPTCLAALAVTAIVLVREKTSPLRLVREISWSVLPLVAALFFIVEAVKGAGALHILQTALSWAEHGPSVVTTLAVGAAIGIGTNLVNNLPLGLITGAAIPVSYTHLDVYKRQTLRCSRPSPSCWNLVATAFPSRPSAAMTTPTLRAARSHNGRSTTI